MKSTIEVFTSTTCPHCPAAKKLVNEVAKERDDVNVIHTITNTVKGSKRAREMQIMTVPTIFIKGPGSDETIGLRGVPSKKGLIKAINISLGNEKWKEKKGLIEKLKDKLGLSKE